MAAILTSWKEIASYLGKGVRTVQRWEREMGLPVRRPKPKQKQIVLAFPDELEEWVRHQPSTGTEHGRNSIQCLSSDKLESSTSPVVKHNGAQTRRFDREELARTRLLLAQIVQQTRILREQTQDLLRSINNLREQPLEVIDSDSDGPGELSNNSRDGAGWRF